MSVSPSLRQTSTRWLLVGLVAWASAGVGVAVFDLVQRAAWDPPQAASWHLQPGGTQVRRLRRFLAEVDAVVPEHSRIVVTTPGSEENAEPMFRYLWVAYLLPRLETVPSWSAEAGSSEYWAVWRGGAGPPAGASRVAHWRDGALFRLPGRAGGAVPALAGADGSSDAGDGK